MPLSEAMTNGKVVDVIIPNDYEVPEPEPGEHPVSVKRAAQLTGYSVGMINARVRLGILPSYMPLGYQRGRTVYVSQLRAVMEAPEVIACS